MRYYRRYSTKFYLSNDIRLNKLQVIWPITRRILFKVKYSEIIQMYNVFKYAFKYRCFFFYSLILAIANQITRYLLKRLHG